MSILMDNALSGVNNLQVQLQANIATRQLQCTASFVDIVQATTAISTVSFNTASTNNTTAVILASAAASGATRKILSINIFNYDTAAATVILTLGALNLYLLIVTLQPGDVLSYEDARGWQVMNNQGQIKNSFASPGATYIGGATSPTAPNSIANYTMQGFGGSITPKSTGNVRVFCSGTLVASAALVDQGITMQLSYGTGGAPGSNAALTGTQAGAILEWSNLIAATAAGDIHVPFTLTALLSLTVGTTYWLDVAAKAITTASVFSISGGVISAEEV